MCTNVNGFSYLGAHTCRRPPKILHSAGVFKFSGSGAGKKDAKIRMLLEIDFGLFELLFDNFSALEKQKHAIINTVFLSLSHVELYLATC